MDVKFRSKTFSSFLFFEYLKSVFLFFESMEAFKVIFVFSPAHCRWTVRCFPRLQSAQTETERKQTKNDEMMSGGSLLAGNLSQSIFGQATINRSKFSRRKETVHITSHHIISESNNDTRLTAHFFKSAKNG